MSALKTLDLVLTFLPSRELGWCRLHHRLGDHCREWKTYYHHCYSVGPTSVHVFVSVWMKHNILCILKALLHQYMKISL